MTMVRRLGFERLDIRVAEFAGDAVPQHAQRVSKALSRRPGLRVRPLDRSLGFRGSTDEGDALVTAELVGRQWLQDEGGDVLIWGEVPPPGKSLLLRFISAVPAPPDRPGAVDAPSLLALPAGFDAEFAPIILATTLAALTPRSATKARLRHTHLQRAVASAGAAIETLPKTLAPIERGTIRARFADAAAQLAAAQGSPVMREIAVLSYAAAITGISETDWPLVRACVDKNRGLALLMEGGSANRLKRLDDAVDALRRALRVLRREQYPIAWATAQAGLGEALYRLEAEGGDAQLLRDAVAAHQAALQVFDRRTDPQLWATVMHNLARTAQVLGEELKNPEVLQKAVDACRSVIEVHTREAAPQQWASTQNDLGSALFLLGRQTGDDATLAAAAEAFGHAREFYGEMGDQAAVAVAIVDRNLARVQALRERHANRPPNRQPTYELTLAHRDTVTGDGSAPNDGRSDGRPAEPEPAAASPQAGGTPPRPPRNPGGRAHKRRRGKP